MIRGIDVAHWQGVIDWQAVADDGVRFAFVKAGSDHSAGGFTPDPTFARNLDGAADAGIPVGVFIYSYAKSTDAVSAGMEKALAMLEPYRSRIRCIGQRRRRIREDSGWTGGWKSSKKSGRSKAGFTYAEYRQLQLKQRAVFFNNRREVRPMIVA